MDGAFQAFLLRSLFAFFFATSISNIAAQSSVSQFVVKTPDFPDIHLKNVVFSCTSQRFGETPCFKADLQYQDLRSWKHLELLINVTLKDGKIYKYTAEPEHDEDGWTTGYVRYLYEPFPFSVANVQTVRVQAIRGMKHESESVPALTGIVATDIGCLKDLARVNKLDGLEQRKAIAERIQYGCVELLEKPTKIIAPMAMISAAKSSIPSAIMVGLEREGQAFTAYTLQGMYSEEKTTFSVDHFYPNPQVFANDTGSN